MIFDDDKVVRLANAMHEQSDEESDGTIAVHGTLQTLSESVFTLPVFASLKHLDLSSNRLTSLPTSIARLTQLITLNLTSNALTTLPDSLDQCTQLHTLLLSGNLLGPRLPDAITRLRHLEVLKVGANRLRELPHTIGQLTRLRTLYLGGNQLDELPSQMSSLVCLRLLYLGDNQLTQLPSLVTLTQLVTLDVHANQLRALPAHTMDLPQLRNLSLRENPLVQAFAAEQEQQQQQREPPTLFELAARSVKRLRLDYHNRVPASLGVLLDRAHRCDNPACNGVYFDEASAVPHIKLADFCGKYQVPMMSFLCRPDCFAREPQPQPADKHPEPSERALQPRPDFVARVLLPSELVRQ